MCYVAQIMPKTQKKLRNFKSKILGSVYLRGTLAALQMREIGWLQMQALSGRGCQIGKLVTAALMMVKLCCSECCRLGPGVSRAVVVIRVTLEPVQCRQQTGRDQRRPGVISGVQGLMLCAVSVSDERDQSQQHFHVGLHLVT